MRILFFFLIMCCAFPAFSQTSDYQSSKYSLGIIGGINFAKMHFPSNEGEGSVETTTLNLMAVGVVLDIRLSNNLFMQIEPMYMEKGVILKEGDNPVDQPPGQVNAKTIEIPLLLKYTFGNHIKPFLLAGPTIGINLSSEIEFDMAGMIFKGDLDKVTETFDLGLTIGGGIMLPFESFNIFLESRYSYGIMNQRKSGTVTMKSNAGQFDIDAEKERDEFTNRGFQILVGALLPL